MYIDSPSRAIGFERSLSLLQSGLFLVECRNSLSEPNCGYYLCESPNLESAVYRVRCDSAVKLLRHSFVKLYHPSEPLFPFAYVYNSGGDSYE